MSITITIDFAMQLGSPTYRASGSSMVCPKMVPNLPSLCRVKFLRAGGAQLGCPSTSGQPSSEWGWFNTYLDYVKQNDVVPNYIGWHELNPDIDPVHSLTPQR